MMQIYGRPGDDPFCHTVIAARKAPAAHQHSRGHPGGDQAIGFSLDCTSSVFRRSEVNIGLVILINAVRQTLQGVGHGL